MARGLPVLNLIPFLAQMSRCGADLELFFFFCFPSSEVLPVLNSAGYKSGPVLPSSLVFFFCSLGDVAKGIGGT